MADYEMERRYFTDEQKVEMAERIAEIHNKVGLLESESKNIKSNYKAKIDTLTSEGKELLWKIHDGYEIVHPEQADLPGFTREAGAEFAVVIDEETGADMEGGGAGDPGGGDPLPRADKLLRKTLKGVMVKAPTIKTISGFTDDEFQACFDWAANPADNSKPAFLGD